MADGSSSSRSRYRVWKASGETDRRALLAGAGVQIYMTPQDDRTAQVLSHALGKHTDQHYPFAVGHAQVLRKRQRQPPIGGTPLISHAEILRFPLDRVLVLPEGQYPILAHHIRYYMDHHFKSIHDTRAGHELPYPPLTEPTKRSKKIAAAPNVAPKPLTQEQMVSGIADQQSGYAGLAGQAAKKQRPTPSASGGCAVPAKRADAPAAKEIAAEFEDTEAVSPSSIAEPGAKERRVRPTPATGRERLPPSKRAEAPSPAEVEAHFEAEGQAERGKTLTDVTSSPTVDQAPSRTAEKRARPKRVTGPS